MFSSSASQPLELDKISIVDLFRDDVFFAVDLKNRARSLSTMSKLFTDEHYRILSRLLTYFSSAYGPHAHLKLIQTLDHSMSVYTSRSSRIQSQLKCRHLISRLLTAAMHKHLSLYHDGGLYFTMIFCHFLLQIREISFDEHQKLRLFRSCLDLIDQLEIPIETVNFHSVQPLLAIVRAVMCKSFAYNSSELIREQLCLLTVKSFLENLHISDQQQLILTIDGVPVEQSRLVNGLLYQTSSVKSSLCSLVTRPCLYFTISLAGDYSLEDMR